MDLVPNDPVKCMPQATEVNNEWAAIHIDVAPLKLFILSRKKLCRQFLPADPTKWFRLEYQVHSVILQPKQFG